MKSQDVVIALKLISLSKHQQDWTQAAIAFDLCISQSEVNMALKRLAARGLLRIFPGQKPRVVREALEEFLIHGFKYVFPPVSDGLTRGIPTGFGAPIFEDKIRKGTEPPPVWPYPEGEKGYALEPLYPTLPKALINHPDQILYDLLTLLDAIRAGRARERQIAIELLKRKLHDVPNSSESSAT